MKRLKIGKRVYLNKKTYFNKTIIKKSISKIAALLMIIGLNWTGLLAVGETLSYFNDIENSAENGFLAGSLDISLDPSGIYISSPMYQTDSAATSISVLNNGSLDTQYVSEIIPNSADTTPCDYVSLDAEDGTQSYSGPLLDFFSGASLLDSSAVWDYTFTIDPLTPPSVFGKTCYFKWVFTAWDKDLALPLGGFIDVEEKSGGIRIGKTIVLNEILADPVGNDNALKPNGEWVELYNNSNVDFDVASWVVYDSDDSHELYITAGNTHTGNTILPARGFLVVYRNGDRDFSINNSNETIRLYNGYPVSSSVLIDSYSWSSAKPEGFSFARIPDGVGAWVDPIPTPGMPNVLEEKIKDIFSAPETYYLAPVETLEPDIAEDNSQIETEDILEIQEENNEVEEIIEETLITEETAPIEETAPTEETVVTEEIVAEETAPVGETASIEEVMPAEKEEVAPEEDNIVKQDDETIGAPESVTKEVQPPEQEPAQNQDVIVDETNDDSIQTDLNPESIIEQTPVIETEPVVVPAEDNSGSDDNPPPADNGEAGLSDKTAE